MKDTRGTISFHNLFLQLEPVGWRGTMAGCKVIVQEHLDASPHTSHRKAPCWTLQHARNALGANYESAEKGHGKGARFALTHRLDDD
jgi:hypothetical protein